MLHTIDRRERGAIVKTVRSAPVIGAVGAGADSAAVSLTRELARGLGAEARFVHVAEALLPSSSESGGMGAVDRRSIAAEIRRLDAEVAAVELTRFATLGIRGDEAAVMVGDPRIELCRLVDALAPSALVVGAPRTLTSGSVARALVRVSGRPVVIAPRAGSAARLSGPVLVDGTSPQLDSVTAVARSLALGLEVPLRPVLCTFGEQPDETVVPVLVDGNGRVTARELSRAARLLDASMIITGARSSPPLPALLGTSARRLMRAPERPVAVVPTRYRAAGPGWGRPMRGSLRSQA